VRLDLNYVQATRPRSRFKKPRDLRERDRKRDRERDRERDRKRDRKRKS